MASRSTSAANHRERLLETSSRCVTETFELAHNFEVTRYSLLDGMGVGKFVSSSKFSVEGYDWKIRFYPDGWREEDKGNISVFLVFCGGVTKSIKVNFILSLLVKDQGSICTGTLTTPYTFESVDKFWGFAKFVQKSKLPQVMPGVDNNDCFTIRCDLTVMKEPRTEAVSTIAVPPSNLHQHFASMLKNGKGVDVKFSVGRQLFSAHACVLAARSPVFMAELFGQMKESTVSCIEVEDMEPLIFEALLHFIYTDSLPETLYIATNAATQNLLVAADRYGVDRLKTMCEEKLCIDIGVQTVATTLALADQHHCVELKDACLRFLSSGDDVRQAVKGTDGFKHLATSCPSLMMEIV
ncbi:hypothetical protein ACQ4PT_069626 [Festuca glaucescens]